MRCGFLLAPGFRRGYRLILIALKVFIARLFFVQAHILKITLRQVQTKIDLINRGESPIIEAEIREIIAGAVEFGGLRAPEVLLNGDHAGIRRWRREQQLKKTLKNRPDLLERAALSAEDRKLLEALREAER